MKKQKPYREMNTDELAEATKEFDAPNYRPRARKPSAAQLPQLRRMQKKRRAARVWLTLSLERRLVEAIDDYAATHGITFSEIVSDALRQWMKKKTA